MRMGSQRRLSRWLGSILIAQGLLLQSCASTPEEDEGLTEEVTEGEENFAEEGEEGNAVGQAVEEGNGAENTGEEAASNYDAELAEEAATGESLDESLTTPEASTDLEEIMGNQAEGQNAAPVAEAPAETTAAEPTNVPAVGLAPALPQMGSKMPYVVRVGDSLSSIAQRVYGSQDKWQEMAELSALANANKVKPGDVLYYQLNQQTMAFAAAHEGAPRQEYQVKAGDSLSSIAQEVYGHQGDWKYVWRQNEIDNPDRLEVGQIVYYLSPAALGAAIDFAKSVSIADLMEMSYGQQNQSPSSSNVEAGKVFFGQMTEV